MLGCGHMVSGLAINKIAEARDSRRKMKCPICQSDQALENNIKVEFWEKRLIKILEITEKFDNENIY